jgi:hypothetical protein
MKLEQIAGATAKAVTSAARSVARFSKLERVLAFVCLFIPIGLIVFDGGQIRESISAYYNMEQNQFFYFSLTVASMLFLVNGIVKHRKFYNTVLGIMLAGVILFNHHDFKILHFAFAIAFFAGNALVILIFSSKKELWFKGVFVAIIAASMVGYFIFDWPTLFWAEWISFGIIAFHYILESWGLAD